MFLKALEACKSKVCIFIDGLDEFEGDTDDLLEVSFLCSKILGVKLCVSSRPEFLLSQKLNSCRMLRLQDMTNGDIKAYVEARFGNRTGITRFVEEVVSSAEGVFLWTTLVTDQLVKGHGYHENEDTLLQRLKSFPKEIDPLYTHMINSIEEVHRDAAREYILLAHDQVVRWADVFLPTVTLVTLAFCFDEILKNAWRCNSDLYMKIGLQGTLDRCRITEDRVQIYCRGLLEIRCTREESRLELNPREKLMDYCVGSEVEFAHRTAYDFLFYSKIGKAFMDSLG